MKYKLKDAKSLIAAMILRFLSLYVATGETMQMVVIVIVNTTSSIAPFMASHFNRMLVHKNVHCQRNA